MNINFFKKEIDSILKLFLLFSFVIVWLSIGIHPLTLVNFNPNFSNYKNILNFFLCISTIFIFIILILLINKNRKIFFSDIDRVALLFILYFICQIIGIISSNNDLINLYYILNSINALLLILLIYKIFSEKAFNSFLIISILILSAAFLFYFYKYFLIFIFIEGQTFYGAWGAVSYVEKNDAIPRPTGLARTALILFIYSYFEYFINNKKNFLYILIFLGTIIFFFQSRAIIFIYILLIIFIPFFLKKYYKFIELNKIVLIFIIIPILLFIICNVLKKEFIKLNLFDRDKIGLILGYTNEEDYSHFIRDYSVDTKYLRQIDPQTWSSGRTRDWKKILSEKPKIFGYGPQGDRLLLDNSTAANALLYALSSAGVIGVLLIILIYFLTLKELYKIYLEKNYYNFYITVSLFFLIILLLRSILESSFAVFGIDYILFLQSYLIIKKNKKIK
jgi:hypothetical protein